MRVERYAGRTVAETLRRLRTDLGEDALVLRTVSTASGVEIVAARPGELERFERSLKARAPAGPSGRRARVVALVGPTGSGKTTTVAKLALHAGAFAGARVGLVSLDTYKIGAFDQIQTYADLADLPLEVLAEPDEVDGAMSRLGRCDVILIDCPGRTPNAAPGERSWRRTLARLRPDEVHLVVPASMRFHLAGAVRAQYEELLPTHVLLTKLDEVPGEAGVAQLADRFGLPARWVADGQSVPDDLHPAPSRLIEAALRGQVDEWPLEATA